MNAAYFETSRFRYRREGLCRSPGDANEPRMSTAHLSFSSLRSLPMSRKVPVAVCSSGRNTSERVSWNAHTPAQLCVVWQTTRSGSARLHRPWSREVYARESRQSMCLCFIIAPHCILFLPSPPPCALLSATESKDHSLTASSPLLFHSRLITREQWTPL